MVTPQSTMATDTSSMQQKVDVIVDTSTAISTHK